MRKSKHRALGPMGSPGPSAKMAGKPKATPAKRINPKNTKVSRRQVVR